MKVDHESLLKIANLSRLAIQPEEENSLLESLVEVLTWMEQLNELDTSGIEPLIHISPERNNLRDDEIGGQLLREQALWNAPAKDDVYFRVPKVIE